MKLKNALLVSLAFVVACGSLVLASSPARSPKNRTCNIDSTQPKTITTGPGALYGVLLGTGAAGQFVVAYDSSSSVGVGLSSRTAAQMFPPIWYGGGAAVGLQSSSPAGVSSFTAVSFDPPIIFTQGLIAFDQAASGIACYLWEEGRGLSGQ